MSKSEGKRKKLVRLIKAIAREEAYAVIDEHLSDFKHEEKSIRGSEV